MKSLAVLNECSFSAKQVAYLKNWFKDAVFYTDTSSEDQAIERIGSRSIIIMDQFMFTFKEKLLQSCKDLELIVLNTTAYDAIDTNLLKQYNVQLANLGEYSTRDVAETVLSMVMSLNNRTQLAQKIVIEDNVSDLYPGHRFIPSIKRHSLKNQTAGIIGLGKIGQTCAKLCLALDMKVFGYNRTEKRVEGVFLSPLKTLCEEADIIVIALSYQKGENENIINQELLKSMKKGAILVSIAHPNLIDMDSLIKISSKFGGVGFDYLVTEKVRELMKIRTDNIIITPHLGSQSIESVNKMTNSLIDVITKFANKI